MNQSRIWKQAFRHKAILRAKQLSQIIPGITVKPEEAEWRHAALQQNANIMTSMCILIAIMKTEAQEMAEAKTIEEQDAVYKKNRALLQAEGKRMGYRWPEGV